jgi:hypothetical protein
LTAGAAGDVGFLRALEVSHQSMIDLLLL